MHVMKSLVESESLAAIQKLSTVMNVLSNLRIPPLLQKALAAAAAASYAAPRSYSSLDEALLQRMAATRLTPQLLAVLMGSADQVSCHCRPSCLTGSFS